MKTLLTLYKNKISKNKIHPKEKVNIKKESYKLLYKYELWKEDNVSNRFDKRKSIIDFLETL